MILQIENESDVVRNFVNIQNEEIASQITTFRFWESVFEYINILR